MSTTPSAHPTFCCSQAGQAGTNQSTPHVLGLFQDPAARQRHRQLLPSENVENEKQNRTVREETRHTVIAITGPFLGSYYCFIPCYLIWPLPWLFKRAQAQARLAASIIISLTQSRKSKSSERANIRSTERTHHSRSRRKDPLRTAHQAPRNGDRHPRHTRFSSHQTPSARHGSDEFVLPSSRASSHFHPRKENRTTPVLARPTVTSDPDTATATASFWHPSTHPNHQRLPAAVQRPELLALLRALTWHRLRQV